MIDRGHHDQTTLRFAGFGGQGIVKAGEIFAAAAAHAGLRVVQTQSYGSSARGGLCTADVTMGSGDIHEIEPDRFDVLVALSQDSCDAFVPMLKPDGLLVIEQALVRVPSPCHQRVLTVDATRIAAEKLGRRIVTNAVVLGFCGAATKLLPRQTLEAMLRSHVPTGTQELNLAAFHEGWLKGEASS